ncbi:JmjC domain-containing protein [Aliivibrio wodanis]|uniref:JmjC domain-containing protein n=1 Tax=Aliivibrio wodanis TaxID=80852 RepID=UPI00406D40F4
MCSIFSKINFEKFINEKWSKEHYIFPTHISNTIDPCEFLNRVINNNIIYYPTLRAVNPEGQVNPLLYTKSTRRKLSEEIDKDKTLLLLNKLGTIKLENIDLLSSEMKDIKFSLESFFIDTKITMNAYISKGPAYGIPSHYDSYHIFAMQLHGTKKWEISDKIVENPHIDFMIKEPVEPLNTLTVETNIGEILYIPPGLQHRAYTEKSSIHIAIGIHTTRIFEFLNDLIINSAAKYHQLRHDMPLNYIDGKVIKSSLADDDLSSIFDILRWIAVNDKK